MLAHELSISVEKIFLKGGRAKVTANQCGIRKPPMQLIIQKFIKENISNEYKNRWENDFGNISAVINVSDHL